MQILGLQISVQDFTLRSVVNRLENAIITLSGPAIAISGIIAGIDLLTGGSMFKDVGWLSLTWAICLLLTLDFQVLMLGARARRVYGSDKGGWRKFFEIVIVLLIAAAISSVSVQMQSIIARSQTTVTDHDRQGRPYTHTISIDQATADMGINPVALIWERSALVLILIFMSGWFRDEEGQSQGHIQGQIPVASQVDYDQIAQQVTGLLGPQLNGLKATILDEIRPLIPASTPSPEPLNYQQLASAIAPLLPKSELGPGPQIDYSQVARAITPMFEARVKAVHTTIVEEIRATIAPLVEPPVAPPQIEARATKQTTGPQPKATGEGQDEATDNRSAEEKLESAYQQLVQEGVRVSGRALAPIANVNKNRAAAWLRATHPEAIKGQDQDEGEATDQGHLKVASGPDTDSQIEAIVTEPGPAFELTRAR